MPGLQTMFSLFRSLLLPSQTITLTPGLQPMLSLFRTLLFGCYTILYLPATLLLVGGFLLSSSAFSFRLCHLLCSLDSLCSGGSRCLLRFAWFVIYSPTVHWSLVASSHDPFLACCLPFLLAFSAVCADVVLAFPFVFSGVSCFLSVC